jgi:hypothetical protein
MAIEYELLLEEPLFSVALRNRIATLVSAVADAEVVNDWASQLEPWAERHAPSAIPS